MGPKPKSTCQYHGDPKLGFKIHKTRDRDPERERERERKRVLEFRDEGSINGV